MLLSQAFPVLRLLLKYFECNPVYSDTDRRMVDIEEDLETSPGRLILTSKCLTPHSGTILHYFCSINFLEGVATLLQVILGLLLVSDPISGAVLV